MTKQKGYINIRISRDAHRKLKIYCAKHGLKLSEALLKMLGA